MMDDLKFTAKKNSGTLNCTVTLEFNPITVEFEEYVDAALRGYYALIFAIENYEEDKK